MKRRKIIYIFPITTVFLFGLIIGSFLNVCIYRIQRKKSIVFPSRSYCPICKKPISWYDNIPLLSFILLKARCRSCGRPISIRYPFVELLTGLLFVFFFLKFGLEKTYFFNIILIGYMIVLTFIDIDKKEVPDSIVLLLFATGFIFNVFNVNNEAGLFDSFAGAAAAGLLIYTLNYVTAGKIGEGDIKLFSAIGSCAGLKPVLEIIALAFIIGGAVSAVLVFMRIYKRSDKIAFVPFISAAFVIRSLFIT